MYIRAVAALQTWDVKSLAVKTQSCLRWSQATYMYVSKTTSIYMFWVALTRHHRYRLCTAGFQANQDPSGQDREGLLTFHKTFAQLIIPGLEFQRCHRGHGLCCPGLGLVDPYKCSHWHSEILIEVPLTLGSAPTRMKFQACDTIFKMGLACYLYEGYLHDLMEKHAPQ